VGAFAHRAAADPARRLTAPDMAETVLYASFVLRLWRDPAAEDAVEQELAWMGELESIQTGRAWQFQGLAPLLGLLAGQLGEYPSTMHARR
jgi:hypothetical protein